MNLTQNAINKIEAVRQLARRGVQGEQTAAQKKLAQLYAKYGIANDADFDAILASGGGGTAPKTSKGRGKSSTPKHNVPKTRPDLVYASPKLIPVEDKIVREGQYKVDKHQLKGINLMLTHFLNKNKKGYLLADGTGVGKTRQILVLAREYTKRTGKKVLIVTENRTIIAGSFASDTRALGIMMTNIELGTYSDIRSGKVGKKHYGLIIFDEAHNLKNPLSQQTIKANSIKADHKVFATATPLDTVNGAAYFVQEVTDMTEVQIYQFLGLKLSIIKNADGTIVKTVSMEEGMTPIKLNRNLIKLRNRLIKEGAMLRREYPFWGVINEMKISLSATAKLEEKEINDYWDEEMSDGTKILSKAGQRSGELSRWNEIYKLPQILAETKEDVSEKKAVVVVAEGINNTTIKGLNQQIGAFIGEYVKRIKTPVAQVYGSNDKASEVAAFQSGSRNILVATPKSGGTGINLDDTVGDRPRILYMVTPNYSGNLFQQILGRVSRRNTKSPSEVQLVYTNSISDERRKQIVEQKLSVLRAIQRGILSEFDTEDYGDAEFSTEDNPKFHVLLEIAANDNSSIIDIEIERKKIIVNIRGTVSLRTFKILLEKYPKLKNDNTIINKVLELDITDENIDWVQRLSASIAPLALTTTTTTTPKAKTTTKGQTKTDRQNYSKIFDLFGNEQPKAQPKATTQPKAKAKATTQPKAQPKATTQPKASTQPKATTQKKSGKWWQNELF